METKKIFEKLSEVQNELKAPKGQKNTFGNYRYRSCEDILEAVKPILQKHRLTLVISDEIVQKESRYYIQARATLYDLDSDNWVENMAFAREEETKKGMDSSQITGAASSYARKYALNGLFNIDDTKDADTDEYTKKTQEELTPKMISEFVELATKTDTDLDELKDFYKIKDVRELNNKQYQEALAIMKKRVNK